MWVWLVKFDNRGYGILLSVHGTAQGAERWRARQQRAHPDRWYWVTKTKVRA